MDFPNYPGTNAVIKLGDPVEVDAAVAPRYGTVTTIALYNRGVERAIRVGVEDTDACLFWADPADLTYRSLPVTVAIPRELADRIVSYDDDPTSLSVVREMSELIREAQADG